MSPCPLYVLPAVSSEAARQVLVGVTPGRVSCHDEDGRCLLCVVSPWPTAKVLCVLPVIRVVLQHSAAALSYIMLCPAGGYSAILEELTRDLAIRELEW